MQTILSASLQRLRANPFVGAISYAPGVAATFFNVHFAGALWL
jgi:hypothetical protein